MKKSTYVYGYGRVDVGDSIVFNVDMKGSENVASCMKVEVEVTKIEDDDTIHFCEGFGTVKLKGKGMVARVRTAIINAVFPGG
ncbi:hypothetical protein KAR91_65240 [Candidatus Pacearchaeota archaeon]|nr:hypothetical protein [Candidatus Pacearchaeota archaeon]